MTESCKTCRHRLRLIKYDYSNGGCIHEDIKNGFICTCFADEGVATWMVGTNEDTERCECYEPKRKEVVRRAEK